MQMVILCGGLATRLGEIAKNTPKAMIDINGKPFVQHQIEKSREYGVDDFVLCVGHLSDKIIDFLGDGSDFDVKISYSHDGDKPLGPIGAIKKAEHLLDSDFFIMYGDSYLYVDFQKVYDYYKSKVEPACMVVYKNNDRFDKSNVILKDNHIIAYGKQYRTKDMIYIDYGTTILAKKTMDLVPPDSFFDTGDFFRALVKKDELLAYEVDKRFYHIGNPDALQELRKHLMA